MQFGISMPTIQMFCSAFFGFMLLAAFVSFEMGRELHWSLGVALGILLLSGTYSFFLPKFYPIPVNPMSAARGGGEVLYSVSMLLLFSFLLLSRSRKFFDGCLKLFFFIAVCDSIYLILGYLFFRDPNPCIEPHGILFNKTADVSFIACLLPLSFQKRWASMIVMLIAVVIAKSNTAFMAVGIGLAFYLLPKMSFKDWSILMAPVTVLFLLFSKICLGDHFLAESGRRFVWFGSMHFYHDFANQWIGIGTGTFSVWGMAWQIAHYTGSNGSQIWNWLHSEPLQILFENGILGLVSSLLVLWFVLKKTYRKNVFPVAMAYAFTGLTEMPLRLFITQVLGVCLLAIAFKEETKYGSRASY